MINLKRGKKGDTVRWNAKKKSGWIYDGTWWRHYRQGKPTGKKEKHRRNAQAQLKGLGVEQVAKFFTATPSQEYLQKRRDYKAKKKAERKEKLKLKKQKERETANEVLNQTPKTSKKKERPSDQPFYMDDKTYAGIQKAKEKDLKKKKNKEILKRAKENLKKPKDSSKTTSPSSSPKKRMTAREKMRAKNVERFGQEHVDKLRAKHADFKKMKKRELSKADFIKKYPKSQTAKRSRR